MAYIKRIAFRHLHALKVQTIGTLGLVAKATLQFDIREWLAVQAPVLAQHLPESAEHLYERHGNDRGSLVQNYAMLLNVALFSYEHSLCDDADLSDYLSHSIKSTSASDHSSEDHYGSDLGGSWDIDGFVLRSSVVLTLSVLEEFERGAIRLLGLRGSSPPAEIPMEEFVPRLADYKCTSPTWEKVRHSVHSTRKRHDILRRYGIEPAPPQDWSGRLAHIRRHRNDIAHGAGAPKVTLTAFLDLHYDVWRAVCHISREMVDRQNIVL